MRRDEERKAREKQVAALQAQQEAAERATRKKQETDERAARLHQETLERQQQAAVTKAIRQSQKVAEKEQREAPAGIVSKFQGSAKKVHRKAAEKPTRERPENMKVGTGAPAARRAQEATISTTQSTEKAAENDPVYPMKARLSITEKGLTAALEAEKVARKDACLTRDKTILSTHKTQNLSQNKIYQEKEASPTDAKSSAKVRMAMMKKPADDHQATQNTRRHTAMATENDPVHSVNTRLAIIKKQEADRIAAMETEKDTKKVIRKSERQTKDRDETLKGTSKPPPNTTNSITIPTDPETPSLHTQSPVPAPKESSKPPHAPTRSSVRSKKPVVYRNDPIDIDPREDTPIPVVGLAQRPLIPARPSSPIPMEAPLSSVLLNPAIVEVTKARESNMKSGIGRRQPNGKPVSVEPAPKRHKNTAPVAAGKQKQNSSLDLNNTTPSTPAPALLELSKTLIVELNVATATLNKNGKRNNPLHDSPAAHPAKAKRQKPTHAARRNPPAPNPSIEMQDSDASSDETADTTTSSADEESAWETSSAASPPAISRPQPPHSSPLFSWPPLPGLQPRERAPFQNGLVIALENVAEDHALNPNLSVLDVILDLEENRPAHHREDWVTRATLKGGTFVYEGLRGLVGGLQDKRTPLGTGEMCLAVGAWARREWERKGWVWPVGE
ncbi:hypothetical protein K505DRAFT_336387 [Melanomma pulvis-pyrius CBS 109.77]|uniref:Uncharacterized protein n=1 Tax=Melanomma pulvis-pyrius CBS 109.77 TaxID=1314802 RepID=A0A6A6XG78_9PLEO|nr:hypothetical protein K505DRAFT_336387 [Melanomma pulvis-pyrius CBS 109.77]